MRVINKFIFTFGVGQLYAGYYQPIYAENSRIARQKMIELHDLKWSHQYTEKEWKENISKGYAIEHPLEAIYCNE